MRPAGDTAGARIPLPTSPPRHVNALGQPESVLSRPDAIAAVREAKRWSVCVRDERRESPQAELYTEPPGEAGRAQAPRQGPELLALREDAAGLGPWGLLL